MSGTWQALCTAPLINADHCHAWGLSSLYACLCSRPRSSTRIRPAGLCSGLPVERTVRQGKALHLWDFPCVHGLTEWLCPSIRLAGRFPVCPFPIRVKAGQSTGAVVVSSRTRPQEFGPSAVPRDLTSALTSSHLFQPSSVADLPSVRRSKDGFHPAEMRRPSHRGIYGGRQRRLLLRANVGPKSFVL